LHQDYFRASAFLGHPLTNAAFTAVSIFIMLSLRAPLIFKTLAFVVMLASLVAFGGRSALAFSVMGLTGLGLYGVWRYFREQEITVMKIILVALAILVVPGICLGLLYAALHSGMGERLMAYSNLQDDSAEVRLWSFRVFEFMTPTDILTGVDGDQVTALASDVGVNAPTTDIENPWILMFLALGGIVFPIWLAGLAVVIWRLGSGTSPAIKMAVIEYFLIASTSNSFGRKDLVFGVIGGIAVCARRLYTPKMSSTVMTQQQSRVDG
jgi:hypothetical protein